MENWTENLEKLSEKVKNLLGAFHRLQSDNQSQKEEISRLKVEIELIRKQNNNINAEHTNQVKTVIEHSEEMPDNTTTQSVDQEIENKKNGRLKTQLDEIIEDLDRCIQIIQTTTNGNK